MKIVITDQITDASTIIKHLPADAEVVVLNRTTHTDEEVIEACRDADAVVAEYAPFNRNVFEHCPKLKMVSNRAMGVDNINLEDAKACKIAIANVPDYCYDEVAEHGMTMIACLLRNVMGYALKVREGVWDWGDGPALKRMSNLTIGLIGCGQIPRRVARMAQGFGMTVIGYDPYLSREVAEKAGIELVTMEELGARSDAVLSHVPLSPATRHLVNKEVFDTFRKHPVFVNTSRGLTVDQKALCSAVKGGVVSRAMLDVVDTEPADFTDEIFSLENVYFTPHAAFYSEDALEECLRRSAMNITNYFSGNPDGVSFVVDPAKL